ncbi:MAG: polysaccharide biosynthesis protein [Thermochromatium sp.]
MNPLVDRLRSRTVAFLHDLLSIPIAWMFAYWLRFNLGPIPPEFLGGALKALPWVIPIQAGVYWWFGLYRGVWRFASIPDLVRITKAVLIGTSLVVGVLFILNRSLHVPRAVPVLYLGVQFILLAGPRLLYRWLKDHRFNLSSGQRVLIVGADRAGDRLARDLLRDPSHAYFPVGFVDDTPRRQGGEVQGLPILGPTSAIPQIVRERDIELIVLAVTGASARERRRLVDLCEQTGRPFRLLPEPHGLLDGSIALHQLRPVSIEDLLGREPVALDWREIQAGLAGRTILVTGAGGSIGSELVRQLALTGPARLILVDNSEFNLFSIEMELTKTHPSLPIARRLLDVTDAAAIAALFADERPAIVFHAAAYKHVPLLEDQPRAAVRNNVFGTLRVAEAAAASGCERFVLISTDKAVNPVSVMGATKRLAEMVCQDLDGRSRCRFITVRFGNVLGSAGSVVPLFRRQIEQGGPVTVTHPEIERFFMTIPEASQLIMQAAVIGDGGEVFVLDMGEPIKIRYLAEQMIRLSGHTPGEDIAIEYIGLRPGEKLYEELFHESEELIETRHPKIKRARQGNGFSHQAFKVRLDRLAQAVEGTDQDRLLNALHELLPEWRSPATHFNESNETGG